MPITVVWSGKIIRENLGFGLVPSYQDVIFVSVDDNQELPSIISQVSLRNDDFPEFYKPYAAYGGDIYLHNEATSNIVALNTTSKEITNFAQIMPSHYFGRQFAVTNDGALLISNSYSFYILSNEGCVTHHCTPVTCEMHGFENPSPEDFSWEIMNGFPPSIACNESTIVLGGHPFDKIYQFSILGKYYRTLRFPVKTEFVHQVAIDQQGRTFVSTENRLYVFSPSGELGYYWGINELTAGAVQPSLKSSMFIDHNGYLWMHGESNGEQVPLYAFELTW